jgi:hypothetical protein
MRHRIGIAIVCLHISAVLYFMVGVLILGIFAINEHEAGTGAGLCMFVFCVALIAGIEVVVHGLHQRKFWAWIAGLCIFGMYIGSLFFPLGALGLWGLLDSGSRAEFGVNGGSRGHPDKDPL